MIDAWGTTRLCFFTDQIKREAPSMDAACGAAVDTITSRYGCVSKFHISTNGYRDRIRRYHVQEFYICWFALEIGVYPPVVTLVPLSNASPDALSTSLGIPPPVMKHLHSVAPNNWLHPVPNHGWVSRGDWGKDDTLHVSCEILEVHKLENLLQPPPKQRDMNWSHEFFAAKI